MPGLSGRSRGLPAYLCMRTIVVQADPAVLLHGWNLWGCGRVEWRCYLARTKMCARPNEGRYKYFYFLLVLYFSKYFHFCMFYLYFHLFATIYWEFYQEENVLINKHRWWRTEKCTEVRETQGEDFRVKYVYIEM